MTTYVVTATNYQDPAFWSAIVEASSGHTLDFSTLPSGYELSIDADIHEVKWSTEARFSPLATCEKGDVVLLKAPDNGDFRAGRSNCTVK